MLDALVRIGQIIVAVLLGSLLGNHQRKLEILLHIVPDENTLQTSLIAKEFIFLMLTLEHMRPHQHHGGLRLADWTNFPVTLLLKPVENTFGTKDVRTVLKHAKFGKSTMLHTLLYGEANE